MNFASYFPITDPTWIFFVVLSVILFAPLLMERLRIPAIVGMIFAGILIGPHGFHILERDDSFELFGKVGLYYIMFLASLEMNLQDVQKIRWRALTLGLLSFAIPMLLGFWMNFSLLGYGVMAAVLMAAMYASHTLISYPIVLRYGIGRRQSVSVAVGGTIIADTLVLLVLAVVGGIYKGQGGEMFWLWLVAKVMVLGALIMLLFPPICRFFFRRFNDGVAQFIFVMTLVFLGAGLMEFVGMEGILGAFLVGLVLNRHIPPSSPLMSHLEFVGNAIFIPYFLIGIGMLINVLALVKHPSSLVVAGLMIVVAIVSKWLAAFLTQKAFRYSKGDRNLIFGLTNSRAAATLAVVLVGYNIILPDGSHLFDEVILNGAMMLILGTCIVSSVVTERNARRLVLERAEGENLSAQEKDRIVIALSNPDTVEGLVNMALMLRPPKSVASLMALNVVLEDEPSAREQGIRQLERARKIATEANVKLHTQSRWAVNIVTGISHALREADASDLLIGLHEKSKLTETFFGRISGDLLYAVQRQIIIYRRVIPINTVRRIHLVVPRKAEFEPGFALWVDRIAQLGNQISCRFNIYSGRQTLAALQAYWESRKFNADIEYHEYIEWHDMLPVANKMRFGHMVAFVSTRKGSISYHNYMERLPEQIERYFSSYSLMIIYPNQQDDAAIKSPLLRSRAPGKS